MNTPYDQQLHGRHIATGVPVLAILGVWVLAVVSGCGGAVDGGESPASHARPNGSRSDQTSQADNQTRKELWLSRAQDSLQSIKDPHSLAFATLMMSVTLADAGHYQQAKQIVHQFIPKDDQSDALIAIAGCESTNGKLEQAIATVDALPESRKRQSGLSLVAVRQAQAGNIRNALALLPKITESHCLDRTRRWIAEAQAKAGDVAAAKVTAAQISNEYGAHDQALNAIATAQAGQQPSLSTVDSPFIQGWLESLLLFSASGDWRSYATQAVAVAKKKNVKELDELIRQTLAATKAEAEPAPSTARLMLCVALVLAERKDESKAMARDFTHAADGEIVGISKLFGRPVLAYLFTRLGMEDELRKVLTLKPGDFMNDTLNGAMMQAVGAAEAEAGNWPGLETRYRSLSEPASRMHLSCGVLAGLQGFYVNGANSPSNSKPPATDKPSTP